MKIKNVLLEKIIRSTQNRLAQSELLAALFRGTAIALGVQILGIGVTYMMQVFLARWLRATQYGVYEFVISIGTLLGFLAGLGLPNSTLRFIPKYTVTEDWGRLRGVIWGSWRYVLVSSLVVTAIALGLLLGWGSFNSDIANCFPAARSRHYSPPSINQTSARNVAGD